MKKIGIVVEFNPLHNGHLYFLNQIKKEPDDILIAVMSGNLVNRGEINALSKFDRTYLALNYGIDLVLELPSIYAMQSAEVFAKNAIDILNYVGIDELYFGSEIANKYIYNDYIDAMNSSKYNLLLKDNLDKGISYKKASNEALKEFNLCDLKSNDTLGLFYYKRIIDMNYKINIIPIKRIVSDYLDLSTDDEIASATAIRYNQENIKMQVPTLSYSLYKEKGFYDNNKIFNYLKYQILSSNNLSNIFMSDEGIYNKLEEIKKYNNLDSFIDYLVSKRYTKTRIKRILLSTLFNITKDNIDKSDINYVRVLGYNKKGQNYLNSIKKNTTIYTNIKEGINKALDIELKISKIIDLIYNANLLQLEQKGPIKL